MSAVRIHNNGQGMQPAELSFPMPKDPHAIIHVHLTRLQNCAIVHLTSTAIGSSSGILAPLGDFTYALPDGRNPHMPLSTILCSVGPNLDYAVRMAKVLARRTNKPVYVGSSVDFSGCTVEEETEGFAFVVEKIMATWNSALP